MISTSPSRPGEPVLDRVGHELGQRERQRRRVLARQRCRTLPDFFGCTRACCGCDATSAMSMQHAVEDVVEVDVLREALERVSCTTAIAATRRMAWLSASRASSECVRRAWMRSSDATVCRLFFTRWWISRIVASLVMSSCSWWRSSVTSRQSTIAPTRSPAVADRDGAQRDRDARASMSVRHGARPVTTSGSDSSTSTLAGEQVAW